MSRFSSVDQDPDPASAVSFLEFAAAAESGVKHYTAAAHAVRRPRSPVLDLGCGAGHDLEIGAQFGLRCIGLDPSAVMLAATRRRVGAAGAPLVRADGGSLPFVRDSLGACRIERVLMHVVDPVRVLAEVHRCLRPGALLSVFEPDWTRFRVLSEVLPEAASWLCFAAHPDAGARLWQLAEMAGFEVLDRVEELSVWRSLSTLERVVGFPNTVMRAIAADRIDHEAGMAWIGEQRRREQAGTVLAYMPKVLQIERRR